MNWYPLNIYREWNVDHKQCCAFFFYFSVDATKETGRLGRLINHSKNGNCQTKLHDINGVPHLILIASRNIDEGEELLYDYGDRSKASIAAHPWLKYWSKGFLETPLFLFSSCTKCLRDRMCTLFVLILTKWGGGGARSKGGWLSTYHSSAEVHLPCQMTSVLLIYVKDGTFWLFFAAHLFCTFCITYRPVLLQHAGVI